MGALENRPKSPREDVRELSEFNIKLYLGVKEFLATLSSFGESSNNETHLNGGAKVL